MHGHLHAVLTIATSKKLETRNKNRKSESESNYSLLRTIASCVVKGPPLQLRNKLIMHLGVTGKKRKILGKLITLFRTQIIMYLSNSLSALAINLSPLIILYPLLFQLFWEELTMQHKAPIGFSVLPSSLGTFVVGPQQDTQRGTVLRPSR